MKKYSILFLAFFLSFSSKAQDLKPSLNFSTAQKIVNGCLAFAAMNKLSMVITIYDSDGQLISFAKMDGASVGTAKVAIWKGLSAATYQYSTEETSTWNVPNAPDIATVPGGILIKTNNGAIIGAIGLSGAASSEDVKCAEAGLKAAGL